MGRVATGRQPLTFISYSRKDKDFALELANELRASGFSIWFDQLDIPTGARWDDEIQKALEQCDIFMVILTPSSTASNNVKDEVGYAIDSEKRILPILLENAKAPFRLRRFQYVDFTNISHDEGIDRAVQLLRKLVNELAVSTQAVSSVAQSQEAQSRVNPIAANQLARQRAEAMRANREREQFHHQAQSIPPVQTTVNKPPERSIRQQPSSKIMPIMIGVALTLFLCLGGFWVVRPYIFPSTLIVPPEIPTTAIPTSEIPLITKAPTNTATFTEIHPSITPAPSLTATVTPFAPQQPDQFIVFYFDTVILDKDFSKGWVLLTPDYQTIKAGGWSKYIEFWGTTKNWTYSDIRVEYNNLQRARVLITYTLFYHDSNIKPSLLDGVRYCLLWDEGIRTWKIDLRSCYELS
jgi:hypothetical protein